MHEIELNRLNQDRDETCQTMNSENGQQQQQTEREDDETWPNLADFTALTLPYFKESVAGRWLFAGMIVITLLNTAVMVFFSYISAFFMNALESKDQGQLNEMILIYTGSIVLGCPIIVLYEYQRNRLSVSWREWMTDRCLKLFSSNRVYYNLERESDIDNPDQRITEDVKSFTDSSLTLFLSVFTAVMDLVAFSFVLYSIQADLLGIAVAYAALGTVMTAVIGKKLFILNYDSLRKEADFRYSLVRIRDNAESIAFYRGENVENKEINKRFERVIDNRREIIVAQRNLEFFTVAYNYFVQVLPVIIVAPRYFNGELKLGHVMQSLDAFDSVLTDLSVIVNQFEELSTISAAVKRLATFMRVIRDADESRADNDGLFQLPKNFVMKSSNEGFSGNIGTTGNVFGAEGHTNGEVYAPPKIVLTQIPPMVSSAFSSKSQAALSVRNLTLTTPDRKRTLISNLNFAVREGEALLIVGSSGAGKSSFLRAIAGLWTSGTGSIERPSDEDVYFLPQRPYCALGSLKNQLLYPSLDDTNPEQYSSHQLSRSNFLRQSLTDQDLLDILDEVDLSELAARAGDGDEITGLYTEMDWSNTLSLGEQQRLAFGRVLVNKPRFLILDEATSALDTVAEAKMYSLIRGRAEGTSVYSGNLSHTRTTIVSVGHRPSLSAYHHTKLRLEGEGRYSMETIEELSADISLVEMSNM